MNKPSIGFSQKYNLKCGKSHISLVLNSTPT
jgi:hypothetical protein